MSFNLALVNRFLRLLGAIEEKEKNEEKRRLLLRPSRADICLLTFLFLNSLKQYKLNKNSCSDEQHGLSFEAMQYLEM